MKQLLIALLFTLVGCSGKEPFTPMVIDRLPDDETEFQKMMLRRLTGEEDLITATGERIRLPSRWNEREKNATIIYLQSLISALDLTPRLHSYAMPNSNLAVDLLIEPLAGINPYTILPATADSDEYVVLGAHYDTDGENFPGALDNGSGVALITSVLRQVQAMDRRTKNLIVVYFDQEEENISAGSIAFANFLQDQEYRIHSVHTYDLIGWDSDDNLEVALELPSPSLEKRYKKHAKRLGIPVYVTDIESSDYFSFIQKGMNAIGISQAYAKGDHSGKKDSTEDKYHLVFRVG